MHPPWARRLAQDRGRQPLEAVYLTAASARSSPRPLQAITASAAAIPSPRYTPALLPVSASRRPPSACWVGRTPLLHQSKEPLGLTTVSDTKSKRSRFQVSQALFIAKRWGSPRQRPSRPAPSLPSKLRTVSVPSSDGVCVLFSG